MDSCLQKQRVAGLPGMLGLSKYQSQLSWPHFLSRLKSEAQLGLSLQNCVKINPVVSWPILGTLWDTWGDDKSHIVAQAILGAYCLIMQARLALNSWKSFCLGLLSAGITFMSPYALYCAFYGNHNFSEDGRRAPSLQITLLYRMLSLKDQTLRNAKNPIAPFLDHKPWMQ